MTDSHNFMGFDLYFDPNQLDLFAGIGRDFKIIGGMGNLGQALKARLETFKGEIDLHPTYGSDLPTLIGQPNDAITRNLAVTLFGETMNEESRIEQVVSISVETDLRVRNIIRLNASLKVTEVQSPEDLYYDFFL